MKRTALLIPTYKRFQDLINTLEKTFIDERATFIIVANLTDEELGFVRNNYGHCSIIVDEREHGKLGGCKAYNLAYKVAKENNFDYAILFADDIIPFDSKWLDKLYSNFINKNGRFGVFCSDECHPGYYGWNIVLDCVIAHFFIIDCRLTEKLFSEDYKQYAIDFEIAVRFKEQGIPIQLLPIKFNHLRSGLHREFMDINMHDDINKLVNDHPKYKTSFKENKNLLYFKYDNKIHTLTDIDTKRLPEWTTLPPKITLFQQIKRVLRSGLKLVNIK